MKLAPAGALLLVTLLAGCGGRFATYYDAPVAAEISRNWTLSDVIVSVPETLTVSETNRFAPKADIVWHGDPEGDRRAQVGAILAAGLTEGAVALQGKKSVVFSATLERFHAVTPRAVASAPGAVHDIAYTLQVFDARTGAPLTQPQRIEAALEANVGAAAVVAAAEGRTQKVRITRHIARVTAAWLGLGEDVRRRFTTFGR